MTTKREIKAKNHFKVNGKDYSLRLFIDGIAETEEEIKNLDDFSAEIIEFIDNKIGEIKDKE